MYEDEKLITVGSFTTVGQAEAARLLLDSQGITCFLSDAEIVNMDWFLSNAVGGVKVQVPESQADRATRILAEQAGKRQFPNADDYGLDREARGTSASDDEDDDEPDPPDDELEADRVVDQAFKAAVFGFFVCPPLLHLYSSWKLLQLPWISSAVSPRKRGLLWAAAALDALVVLGLAAYLGALVFQNAK